MLWLHSPDIKEVSIVPTRCRTPVEATRRGLLCKPVQLRCGPNVKLVPYMTGVPTISTFWQNPCANMLRYE
eukprot:6464281-Amphidinium_carterae.3